MWHCFPFLFHWKLFSALNMLLMVGSLWMIHISAHFLHLCSSERLIFCLASMTPEPVEFIPLTQATLGLKSIFQTAFVEQLLWCKKSLNSEPFQCYQMETIYSEERSTIATWKVISTTACDSLVIGRWLILLAYLCISSNKNCFS